MHDGNNFDPVVTIAKEYAEGEGVQETAPDSAIYLREEIRVDTYAGNAIFERG